MEEGDRDIKSEGDVTIETWSLALSMEKGARTQGMWLAPGSWRRQRNGVFSRASRKECSPAYTLILMRLLLVFWPTEHLCYFKILSCDVLHQPKKTKVNKYQMLKIVLGLRRDFSNPSSLDDADGTADYHSSYYQVHHFCFCLHQVTSPKATSLWHCAGCWRYKTRKKYPLAREFPV